MRLDSLYSLLRLRRKPIVPMIGSDAALPAARTIESRFSFEFDATQSIMQALHPMTGNGPVCLRDNTQILLYMASAKML